MNFSFCIRKLAVAFHMINEIQPKIKFQNIVQCPFKFFTYCIMTIPSFTLQISPINFVIKNKFQTKPNKASHNRSATATHTNAPRFPGERNTLMQPSMANLNSPSSRVVKDSTPFRRRILRCINFRNGESSPNQFLAVVNLYLIKFKEQ